MDAIEEFHPDRVAGRILGMGDIATLVEQAQKQYDVEQAAKLEAKMQTGKFSLDDFLVQLRSIKKMGSLKDLVKKELVDQVVATGYSKNPDQFKRELVRI